MPHAGVPQVSPSADGRRAVARLGRRSDGSFGCSSGCSSGCIGRKRVAAGDEVPERGGGARQVMRTALRDGVRRTSAAWTPAAPAFWGSRIAAAWHGHFSRLHRRPLLPVMCGSRQPKPHGRHSQPGRGNRSRPNGSVPHGGSLSSAHRWHYALSGGDPGPKGAPINKVYTVGRVCR